MRASPARTISEKVNRVVYQAFLTAVVLALFGILAPLGYVLSPHCCSCSCIARGARGRAAVLRTMFVCSIGQLLYFMLAGALRAAGRFAHAAADRLVDHRPEHRAEHGADSRAGSDSRFRRARRGARHVHRFVRWHPAVGIWLMITGRVVVRFSRAMPMTPDWAIIRSLFRFGLPAGVQGVAMNIAGVLLLRFIGSLAYSAEAQAAYAVGYTELFSFITWTSVGLMGAAAAIAGQNLGAGQPERSVKAVQLPRALDLMIAAHRHLSLVALDQFLGFFGLTIPSCW